ncbi:MAG TPA: rhomboid family intramembrane serine protease [Myxococcaceae bacterium]|nr:rhomboid family intramembrane serine protease [Myxococcaceae bacterium]
MTPNDAPRPMTPVPAHPAGAEPISGPHAGPPLRRPQFVSWFIIIAAGAAYLAESLFRMSGVTEAGALYGPWVQAQPWRILSYTLVHGGPLHLLFNLLGVWNLGIPLERAIGSGRFLLLSLAACLGASAAILFVDFDQATVGVSGVILGWLGAALLLVRREGRQSLVMGLVQIAVISVLPGVSWAGHLGGLLVGLPLGWALRKGPSIYAVAAPVAIFLGAVLCTLAATRAG